MTIQEAKKLVTVRRIGALLVMLLTFAFILFAGLKSIYFALQNDTSVFSEVSNSVLRAIYFVYERTQGVSLIWEFAPIINPMQPNSPGNFGFLFILCCGALARMMWNSAAHLSSRIVKTLQRVEEVGWEQAMMAPSGRRFGGTADVLKINIELEQKDKWYQLPTGMILIGVAIGVLGQWANLRLGLIT